MATASDLAFYCGDDRRIRRMHVLIWPQLLPYTSVVTAKLQDLRPSPSFTKSPIDRWIWQVWYLHVLQLASCLELSSPPPPPPSSVPTNGSCFHSGHENNVHCIGVAINYLAAAMFSSAGNNSVHARVQQFMTVSCAQISLSLSLSLSPRSLRLLHSLSFSKDERKYFCRSLDKLRIFECTLFWITILPG